MKIKALLPIIIIGFVLAFAFHFNAIADLDAPHNDSNHVFCGSCHGYSRAGIGTGDFCTDRCHSPDQYCPFTEDSAPLVKKHLDSDENELADCYTCHDPHYQKQKNYSFSDPNKFYIAKGKVTAFSYNSGTQESTLNYSDINYKTGWDATKLTGKTDTCRRAILFPNRDNLGYSYSIIEITEDTPTEGTMKVKGKVNEETVYMYKNPPTDFVVLYGQYIKDKIKSCSITTAKGCNKNDDCPVGEECVLIGDVKFFGQTGINSFADGDGIYDGVCEVCHTGTEHYRNEGAPEAPDQHHSNVGGADGTNCISCHSHVASFVHGGGSGIGCEPCHGHDEGYEYETDKFSQGKGTYISHSTHTEDDIDDKNGPELDCPACHDTSNYPFFNYDPEHPEKDSNGDGKIDLSETDVCDNCHSIGGAYDGVGVPYDDDNPNFAVEYPNSVAYGAKYHWKYKEDETWFQGIYSEISVKYWQPNTHYNLGDLVRYKLDVYRAKEEDFTSGDPNPIGSNWDIVDPWQPNTSYVADTYVRYLANVYRCPSGFTSGDTFNDVNWETVGRWLEPLKTGKEKWCIGCHDDVPASSKKDGTGVLAPKVGGDNSIYGFYVSGHGRAGIGKECLDCHDAIFKHIDNNSRTYEVGGSVPGQTYRYGYRLNEDMAIPRDDEDIDVAFKLCMGACHDAHDGVFSDDMSNPDPSDCNTHFRYDYSQQLHDHHVIQTTGVAYWDSDWNGQVGEDDWAYKGYLDSAASCPTCHNVHGSPSPAMTRHGELISTPTNNKVPAFDFRWYKQDKATQTNVLKDSSWEYFKITLSPVENNYVCNAAICHSGSYNHRFPGCPEIAEMEIWTTDLNDSAKNEFDPGESIRFHIRVVLTGLEGDEYFLQSINSKASGPIAGGGTWQRLINVYTYRSIGEHTSYWDRTVPSNAEPGSTATYFMDLFMLDEEGGYPIDRQTQTYNFYIEPWPP